MATRLLEASVAVVAGKLEKQASGRAGELSSSRRAGEQSSKKKIGGLAWQGERSLGSRKKFAIWTVCRCREAFTENLALDNFRETQGRMTHSQTGELGLLERWAPGRWAPQEGTLGRP